MKILNYAINSPDIEHVSILININKWMRRICVTSGQEAEIYFLTSSDFGSIVNNNDFPAFTLPSTNSLKPIGMSDNYKKIARQWIWNSINLISPDILIVDSFPNGFFNEIEEQPNSKKIFIYQTTENDILNDKDFQKSLTMYDKIIIESECTLENYKTFNAVIQFNKNHVYQTATEILKGNIDDNIIEHVEPFIPEDFFHTLHELNISENIALRTINILDSNFHNIIKLNQSLEFVSSYFDFDDDIKNKFQQLNSKLYNDFIDYPLNNLALMFLRYVKSKDIDYNIGNNFLECYIKTNETASKSIQVLLMDVINYLSLLLNKNQNINDQLLKYISEINNQSTNKIRF